MYKKQIYFFISILFILSLVLAACQTAIPATEEPIIEESVSEPAESAPPLPTSTSLPPPNPAEQCKLLNNSGRNDVGMGFPVEVTEARLATLGQVNGIILFADFDDAPANQTPEEIFALISPGAEEFFKAISYGRMDLQLTPYFEWLRLSQPSSEYATAITTHDGHKAFLQEAIGLADAAVDFAATDIVILVNNPNASAIGYGPTWIGTESSVIMADGNKITNGITSGADLTYWGYKWLPHEMGHSMGLADLYSFIGEGLYTGTFSMMGDIAGQAPEYSAYERWRLGWLDNEQVICQDNTEEQTVTITPIETEGGIKTLVIRNKDNDSRALVIESRRALGYDNALTTQGAVVYTMDTSIPTGEGPLVAENNKQPLQVGQSLTLEGVTITFVESTADGDTIQVTPAQ